MMKIKTILTICCLSLIPSVGHAQDVDVLRPLDFGEVVITNNAGPKTITLQANGTYSADGAFIFTRDPAEGRYRATGLPPSTAITDITVTVDQQMLGPGEDFFIDNFDIDAPSSTDTNGELLINLGARLQTTGSGQPYIFNAMFQSTLTLDIQY